MIRPSIVAGPLAFAAVLGGSAAVENVAPPAPHPITVHSLAYVDQCDWRGQTYAGCIRQDRTVTPPEGENTFAAVWAAQIVDGETGLPVAACEGSGGNPYRAGQYEITMPLHIWTGNPACTIDVLSPGEYKPSAVWSWGVDEEHAMGPRFTVGRTVGIATTP